METIFNFVPEDNQKINNKNDNPNKLIIGKKSKWLIKSCRSGQSFWFFGHD